MSDRVNLRPVLRAMNEHSDVEWSAGYKEAWCYYQGRKRILVNDQGEIKIGRAVIRPEDRELLRDILDALDGTFIPHHVRGKL